MLTSAQRTALKTDILANPDATAIYQNGDLQALAALYNAAAVPAFWTWRTSVTKSEFVNSVGPDGTTFSWTGTGFIGRSVGEQAAWQELFASGAVNPSLPNVRQAFADIFSGATAPAPANRTHLLAMARRLATRAERLFATGTGTTASPGTLAFEGAVTVTDLIGV
jgi:hypothetical protein